MASLALPFRTLRPRPLLALSLPLPTLRLALPTLTLPVPSLLGDLWEGILRAVPKKKVSHSRKAMRSAGKGPKDRKDIVHCPATGAPKRAHHLSPELYHEITREWKASQRAAEGGAA